MKRGIKAGELCIVSAMRGSGKSMAVTSTVLFNMAIADTAIYDEYERLHSTDGPAAIFDGVPIWSIAGTFVTFDQWCEQLGKLKKEKALLLLKYKTNSVSIVSVGA